MFCRARPLPLPMAGCWSCTTVSGGSAPEGPALPPALLSSRWRCSSCYPKRDGRWFTAEPHLCGQDHYSAELTETEGGFLLGWQIRGRARTSG